MTQNAQLMAMIYVDSVEKARAFYVESLGFSHMMGMLGNDGFLDFCTVTLGGVRVMLMRPTGEMQGTEATTQKRPVELYIQVDDVDAYHDSLKKNGVRPSTSLTNQWWGDRTFTVMDPFGYLLWFYQSVAEPILPQGAKVV